MLCRMAASSTRNNILAGGFLLSAVVLGVLASFVLSDAKDRLRASDEYTVRFSIAQGATGIQEGSPVLLGGQPVGKVTAVEIKTGVGDAATGGGAIDVQVTVHAEYRLADNALIYLEKPLLGTLTSINIASVGSVETVKPEQQIGPGPELAPGETIHGAIAPPSFLADAGLGGDQVAALRRIIEQAEATLNQVSELLEKNSEPITATVADIRSATGQFAQKVPGWTERVDSILSQANATTQELPNLGKSAQGLIDDGRSLVADAKGLLNDNRPKLNQFVDDVAASAASIRNNIDPLVTRASDALASFDSLSQRLDTIVATETPNVRRTLANARLASDQLKLALLEIRAQPWRLLVQPDTKELQEQLLYDSARSYAASLSDLRAASEALEVMVSEGAAAPGISLEDVTAQKKALDDALARYRQAEQALFDQIQKTSR